MKRFIALALVLGLVAVFAITSIVNAQKPTPQAPGQGYGYGMMGGRGGGMMGGRGGMMGGTGGQGYGLMQPYMQKELAAKLGVSEADLQAAYAKGQTFWQVAAEKGFTTEQAQQMMVDARAAALDTMVADGVITKEQADWMKTRMNGNGAGGCTGGGNTGIPRGRSW